MVELNLQKKETENIGRNIKVADVLLEARNNHNELVEAIMAINATLVQINDKLKENPDIIDSVTFNAQSITDVETKLMPALEAKMSANLQKVKVDLLLKVKVNDEKVVAQEGHSRRRNIIINGKQELDKEDTEEVVKQFLVNDLKIEDEQVTNIMFRDVHRLPKSKNKDGSERNTPRPIIAAFLCQKDRNAVMRKAFELKNTNFSIKTDLPKELNDIRGKMLQERLKLKTANPTVKYRVAERAYKPVLQRDDGLMPGTTRIKWIDIKLTT